MSVSSPFNNPDYLTTDALRARYGAVTYDAEGEPKFERSRMWIHRRIKDDGFPKAIHFGSSKTNFWVLADVKAWEIANRDRLPTSRGCSDEPGRAVGSTKIEDGLGTENLFSMSRDVT